MTHRSYSPCRPPAGHDGFRAGMSLEGQGGERETRGLESRRCRPGCLLDAESCPTATTRTRFSLRCVRRPNDVGWWPAASRVPGPAAPAHQNLAVNPKRTARGEPGEMFVLLSALR